MGNILFKAIAGMIAGLAAWAMVEPFKPAFFSSAYDGWEKWLVIAWALALGATIGFMSGYQRGSKTHAWRECGISAVFAVVGIMTALPLTTPFAHFINPEGNIIANIIPRTITIAMMGGGLGFGIGMGTFVLRRGVQGLIGGLIGGAIAGALFDFVATATSGLMLSGNGVSPGHQGEVGAVARALTAIIMCGAIALMIGIIEALSRSAWLRLELGRNEGKEWVLDKAQMVLGRFERADIPLFGDQNVVQQHAIIQKQGNQFVVIDQGSPIGIAINGNRVQQSVLNAGDVLQIGSFNLRFLMKNMKAPNRGPEPNRNMAYSIGGQQARQYPQQPAASSQLMTPSQMAMQQQQQIPTQMGQPMQPTMMNPSMGQQMQPTMMNQPYGNPMDPTVAVPQGGFQPTMAQSGMSTLVVMDGPLNGQRFPVTMPIELGRECQQVPMAYDTSASRKHARIEPSGQFVNVTDLGSTNGTFINGQRVTNAIAKNGDIVKVGATNFRIES
jgi:pSer/pThr/pTyr-binding forkhead associated (FHA) protein